MSKSAISSIYYNGNKLNEYNYKFSTAVIQNKWLPTLNSHLKIIMANKSRYQSISVKTGVPWYFIAVLHMRESTLNFGKHLHEGSPLTGRTKLVPRGLPKAPPANGIMYTFEESAIDALYNLKKLQFWKDWSIGGMLYVAEMWNGAGYIKMGRTNPYLWSGTQHYTGGKYIADGKYSSTAKDGQLGVAILLKYLLQTETANINNNKPAPKGILNKAIDNVRLFFNIRK